MKTKWMSSSLKFEQRWLWYATDLIQPHLGKALIVIHKCPEARHSRRDCRNPGYMDVFELTIHGTGYPLPGGYDELPAYLCITMRVKPGSFLHARDLGAGTNKPALKSVYNLSKPEIKTRPCSLNLMINISAFFKKLSGFFIHAFH